MNIEALKAQYTATRNTLISIKESFASHMPEHPSDDDLIDWAARHIMSQHNCMVKNVDEMSAMRVELEKLRGNL